MVTGESQKQLLTLIRDFATERSQGDRRVSDLKKRLLELQVELDVANADLDEFKRSKETSEQELRASQLHLSMTHASIQAQEARISLLQEAISTIRSDLDALKNDEGTQRDEFISTMCELNKKIRKFQQTTIHISQKQQCPELLSDNGKKIMDKEESLDVQGILKGLEDKITCINTDMHMVEGEYQDELHGHDEFRQKIANMERRILLAESVLEETKQLQDLAGLTSELEKRYASLGEESQRMYTCPTCQFNNIGNLDGTSLTDGEN